MLLLQAPFSCVQHDFCVRLFYIVLTNNVRKRFCFCIQLPFGKWKWPQAKALHIALYMVPFYMDNHPEPKLTHRYKDAGA